MQDRKANPNAGHSCQQSCVEHLATEDRPFHFTDSGLPNVYLIGIKYFTCECSNVVAEIPALKPLMRLIARDVIANPGALTGEEIRFLRKRLGMRAIDFAKALGLEPETLSRIENNKQPASEQSDKLIRLVYAVSAKDDPAIAAEAGKLVEELISSWSAQHSQTKIVKKMNANEWTDYPKAA